MKLSIRYADKIVGVLILAALGILIFVIFMLGSSQRWFSRDYYFLTYFPSAAGLSQNMAVQYKGFTIGHVKSVRLAEDDRVEVRFSIFDTYRDRVKYGSLVEVSVSPIGGLGGNQFLFYPGKGSDLLDEGETIPTVHSSEGRAMVKNGLADLPEGDDGIGAILTRAGTLVSTLNSILADVEDALRGTDSTALGKTLLGLQLMTETLPNDIGYSLNRIVAQIEPVLVNLEEFTDRLADPDETVMSILDADGDIYKDLVKSLNAVSGTLRNLERTTDTLPAHLSGLLSDLETALINANDVLVALTNNPLLRRGIPERKETNVGGGRARDIEF